MTKRPSAKDISGNRNARSRRKFLNVMGGTAVAAAAGVTLGDSISAEAKAPRENMRTLDSEESATGSEKKPSFKEFVTGRLEELTAMTALDGPIFSELSKVRRALDAVSARLDSCDSVIGDPNQLKAITETLCEIKRALGMPCP